MRNRDENYNRELEARLSQGQEPHNIRPFTHLDKIRVILKTHLAFDEHEYHILNSFLSSKGNRKETLDLHDISKDILYRLLKRVDEVFEPDSQTRDTSKNP